MWQRPPFAIADDLDLPLIDQLSLFSPEFNPGDLELISPLKIGDRAPFAGILLSPPAVSKIIVDIKLREEGFQIRLRGEILRVETRANLDMLTLKNKLESDLRACHIELNSETEKFNYMATQLQKERSRIDPWVVGSVAFVGGLVLGLLTVILIKSDI